MEALSCSHYIYIKVSTYTSTAASPSPGLSLSAVVSQWTWKNNEPTHINPLELHLANTKGIKLLTQTIDTGDFIRNLNYNITLLNFDP